MNCVGVCPCERAKSSGDGSAAPRRRCVVSSGVANDGGHLVWIDCEMTGLDLASDKLIEVAVVVTDSQLRVLDPGLDLIISADDADLDRMNEVVAQMHA